MEDLEKALRPILVNIASAGAIFQRHEDTFRERLRLKVEEFQKNGLLKDIRYDATPEQQSKRQRTKESLLSPAVVKNINSELNAAASKQNTRSKKSSLLSENQEEDFKPPKSKENDSSRLNVPAGYRKSRANSDDSVIVLGSNEKEVVELSDDETSAMPPPPAPPAKNKRTARTKKRSESQDSTDVPLRITRSRIKKEKISVAGSSTMISTETDTATTDLIPKCVVKVERLSNITKAITKNAKDKTKRQSAESVYEDAASEMADPVDSLPSTTFNVPKSDAAVDDITTAISNTTITLSSDQVMNETYQMPRTENTFTMNKENDGIQSPSEIANSIMTDDLSYEEEIAVTKKPLGKAAQLKKKELFNPFEQSPVKQKVAAFEKIAQSGVKNVEGSANGKQRSVIPKMAITPIKHTVVTKPSTPLNQVYTSIVKSSSSSKLAHLQKIHSASKGCASTGKIGSASSSQPLSREHSAEDVRRGLAEKAEEKKKKRELKQAQVQQQREAREQEKLLKHKKALEEKEEKLRQDAERRKLAKEKKAIEMERKRQLEEINRNLRMEEARREEHLRSEEQNRLEKELLKQMAKAKIEESSSADITNPILKQQIKDFNRDKHPEYDFHMLRSDDETDDEDQPQASNKRPPPPDWSRSSNRKKELMKQQYCASPIVDTFFGVQPRTANLLELFPTIDPKYLKRNSSAIWNTSID